MKRVGWIVIGLVAGGTIGGVIGYINYCNGATWRLTSNPWSGAALGIIIGLVIALLFTCNLKKKIE